MIARLSPRLREHSVLQTVVVVLVAAAAGLMPLANGAGTAEAAGGAGHDATNCSGGYF